MKEQDSTLFCDFFLSIYFVAVTCRVIATTATYRFIIIHSLLCIMNNQMKSNGRSLSRQLLGNELDLVNKYAHKYGVSNGGHGHGPQSAHSHNTYHSGNPFGGHGASVPGPSTVMYPSSLYILAQCTRSILNSYIPHRNHTNRGMAATITITGSPRTIRMDSGMAEEDNMATVTARDPVPRPVPEGTTTGAKDEAAARPI